MLNKFWLAGILAVIILISGSVSATSYIHGANNQLVAKINGSGDVTYYHPDHLGSTSSMTNEEGEVIDEQVNLPFGEQISGSEKYGFTAKELDETNLHYFGARYYDPNSGRFFTIDPALQDFNPYGYCANNPLVRSDPDGMRWWTQNVDIYPGPLGIWTGDESRKKKQDQKEEHERLRREEKEYERVERSLIKTLELYKKAKKFNKRIDELENKKFEYKTSLGVYKWRSPHPMCPAIIDKGEHIQIKIMDRKTGEKVGTIDARLEYDRRGNEIMLYSVHPRDEDLFTSAFPPVMDLLQDEFGGWQVEGEIRKVLNKNKDYEVKHVTTNFRDIKWRNLIIFSKFRAIIPQPEDSEQ